MKKIVISLQSLGNLLSFDFRGTTLNKELEKFFVTQVLPNLRKNPKMIESTIKDLNNNPLLLYILIKEVPMTMEQLIYVTERFFDEIHYREGVNSHVKSLLGNFFEGSFTNELCKQLIRLKKGTSKEKMKKSLWNLFTMEKGNAGAFIVRDLFLNGKFFDLNTLIDLLIFLKNYRSLRLKEGSLRSVVLSKILELSKGINSNETLKNKLIYRYFDKSLQTVDTNSSLEEVTFILLKKLKLSKKQILHIKGFFDVWYLSLETKRNFCNLVFSYQDSISSSEVKKWINQYEIKAKQETKSRAMGSGGRPDHC